MARPQFRKYLLYTVLVLLGILIIWVFGLEEEYAVKSKIKALIRALT